MVYPNRQTAEQELLLGEQLNPEEWIAPSQTEIKNNLG